MLFGVVVVGFGVEGVVVVGVWVLLVLFVVVGVVGGCVCVWFVWFWVVGCVFLWVVCGVVGWVFGWCVFGERFWRLGMGLWLCWCGFWLVFSAWVGVFGSLFFVWFGGVGFLWGLVGVGVLCVFVLVGFVPYLDRRFGVSESATVRVELAIFVGSQPCPDC
ncbi:hypothetical protein, partial [Pseudomonas syringae group genomosp. 7]|uniref:hypothetical protein n=1 Tax=Pseudomonas syringae group genomosp. 7 TaxID=251699 RepID=UPI00376F776E